MATVKTFFILLYLLLKSCICSDVNCNHGQCKPITDTTQAFCECHKRFKGSDGTWCGDPCQVKPCGVNARCSSSNDVRSCSCENPWKGDPYQGCRSQDLQWVQTRGVPSLCKATGPDSGSHSGFVKDEQCVYEYDGRAHRANIYEVLVDPCEGRGWKWMEGAQPDMVSYDESKRFPGVKYYVCSVKSDGVVGKLFNTRSGFQCHVAKDKTRDGNFYALVPQPCI